MNQEDPSTSRWISPLISVLTVKLIQLNSELNSIIASYLDYEEYQIKNTILMKKLSY